MEYAVDYAQPALTPEPLVQYAALPWKRIGRNTQMLLVTTRGRHQWIIPKGNRMPGVNPHRCVAREAFEEAGVVGRIAGIPIGSFQHTKRKNGRLCHVQVYAMQVFRQCDTWAERNQRGVFWCSIDQAIELVNAEGLRRVLWKFRAYQDLPSGMV